MDLLVLFAADRKSANDPGIVTVISIVQKQVKSRSSRGRIFYLKVKNCGVAAEKFFSQSKLLSSEQDP